MAVVVDVLKLTQVQGVCAVRGTAATGTIALATTLKKSTETQSSPKADIKALHWTLSASASAKVQRNSDVLYELTESGSLDFYGFNDNHQNDIIPNVNIPQLSVPGANVPKISVPSTNVPNA